MNKKRFDRFDILMNPAIGSITISSFVEGYSENEKGVPFILCFFAIPLVFQEDIRNTILSSNNFNSFLNKLKKNHNDRIALIHKNVKSLRYLTLKSLLISSSANLLKIDSKKGIVIGNKTLNLPTNYSENCFLNDVNIAANKLGKFFSKTQIRHIFQKLNVEA